MARKKAAEVAEPETEDDLLEQAKEVFKGDISTIDGVYCDPNGKIDPLGVRIAKIIHSLPDIQPEGKNTHFNYKFITDKQVNGALRPRMSRQRIIVIPETVEERDPIELTTQKGGRSLLSRITVTWRVMDGITGESFTGQSVGYGDDSGDKGANKAFTAAFKNYLIKLFQIGGDTDIEEDEGTDRRAAARETGADRVSRVDIEDVEITGVGRGGKAAKVTEVQLKTISTYVRDLELSAAAVASLIERVLEEHVELGDKPWNAITDFLTNLSGAQAGKLIATLDALHTPATTEAEPPDEEPSPLGY